MVSRQIPHVLLPGLLILALATGCALPSNNGQYADIQSGYIDQGREILCVTRAAGFYAKYHNTDRKAFLIDATTHKIIWSVDVPRGDGGPFFCFQGAIIRSGNSIYMIDGINRILKQLPLKLCHERIIGISKDMTKIATILEEPIPFWPHHVYIADLKTNNKEQLSYFEGSLLLGSGDFSRDNSKLIISDMHNVYSIDLQAHNFKKLNAQPLWDPKTSLSPNGDLVSILSDGDILYTAKPDSTEMHKILDIKGKGMIFPPEFSPDGLKLTFTMADWSTHRADVFSIKTDGSQLEKIIDGDVSLDCISADFKKGLVIAGRMWEQVFLYEVTFAGHQAQFINLK